MSKLSNWLERYLKNGCRNVAVLLAIAGVVLVVGAFGFARSAACYDCIPTFCGHSAECPGKCFCAIPMGSATGTCSGTR